MGVIPICVCASVTRQEGRSPTTVNLKPCPMVGLFSAYLSTKHNRHDVLVYRCFGLCADKRTSFAQETPWLGLVPEVEAHRR